MLNTDICLYYDVEEEDGANGDCCTRTDAFRPNGTNRCPSFSNQECARIDPNSDHPRAEAAAAVNRYLGGNSVNDNQAPFYDAFALAWFKGEMTGRGLECYVSSCLDFADNLLPIVKCSHDERFR